MRFGEKEARGKVLIRQNLAAFQEAFIASRHVVVPDFVDAAGAERTHAFLARDMPEDWWVAAIRQPFAHRVFLKNSAANRDAIRIEAEAARASFARGAFCYFHFRTVDDHYRNCGCQVCIARRLLQSAEMADALRSITGLPLERPREVFASRYGAGCFLGIHTDGAQGRVAFVWNLTKDWNPQFGGNLHLLESGTLRTRHVISPDFNSLAVFAVGDGVETPHFVSQVAPGVTPPRFAFSGWYS